MRSITLAVSLILALVSTGHLVGTVPEWLFSTVLLAGLIAVSIDLYLQRDVILDGESETA